MGTERRDGTNWTAGDNGVPVMGKDRTGAYRVLDLELFNDPVSTNEVNVPAAHAAAVITLDAIPNEAHVVSGVVFSYAAAANLPSEAAPGRLTIADGSDTIFDLDVPHSGVYTVPFVPPKSGHAGRTMTITLADGGAAVQGKLNLIGHWLRYTVALGVADLGDEVNSGLIPLFF